MDKINTELKITSEALVLLSSLDEDARIRAITWLSSSLGIKASAPTAQLTPEPNVENASDIKSFDSPKEFMTAKKPTSDVEQVACLGYFLTKYRGAASFDTRELVKLNLEAAAPRITNPSRAVDNATIRNEYFVLAGKGKKQMSAIGENVVEALPDRSAVKAALAAAPRKRKRVKATAKKKTASAE